MKRLVSFASATPLLFGAVVQSPAAHAQERRVQHPPPPAIQRFEPIEPNPYFVQDPDDPRVLLPAPGARDRGIDRGYVERMVRGDLPDETLDLLDETGVPARGGLPEPPGIAPRASTFATVLSGNIIVVEGDEALVPNTQNGRMFDHRGDGALRVIQNVWSRLGDEFDFVTVFTTFDDAGVAAYYLPLQQDTTGLGACNFNTGETFGCVFSQFQQPGVKLQGFVFMNSLRYWDFWDQNYDGQSHELTSFDASVYAVLGQEVGHRWGAGLRFVDPRTDQISKKLLGRDNSHWAAWVDTDASVMDGWDWSAQDEQGQFTLQGDMDGFSLLDLYAMGAVPVASPKPFFFIDDARYVPNNVIGNEPIAADAVLRLPSVAYLEENGITLRATGEQVDLTIQDIVNAEGVRCPDKDHTQKTFRQAVVLVTRPGETAAEVADEVARLETVLATWEDWWADRTGHALTLCTAIDGPCDHPVTALGESHVEDENDDGVLEPGESFDLVLEARSESARIYNARVQLRLLGNGAEATKLGATEVNVGELAPGERKSVKVPLSLTDDYDCGYSVIVEATLLSDNAEPVREEYRLFPGYAEVFAATFDEGDDGFTVNSDGKDDATRGALERTDVALSCTMTPRTPERDASPGGKGAFVTANDGELSGTTSLWSGELDISGTIDPELRFAYWLDGAGGQLKVLVSRSGNGFTEAKVYDEPDHGWSLGRVVLRDVYEDLDEPFEKLHVVFIFEGEGRVEGGIDEVRVLDPVGICLPPTATPICACESTGDAETDGPGRLFGLAALLGLGGLLSRRRRD